MRYIRICKKSSTLAAEACKTQQGYDLAIKTIDDLAETLAVINSTPQTDQPQPRLNNTGKLGGSNGSNAESSVATLKDPMKKVSRGRPKNEKMDI